MQNGTTKIAPGLTAQIELEVASMLKEGKSENRFQISNTSVQIWLVKTGTPEAEKREADRGSIMSEVIEVAGSKFFLARR